MWCVCEEVKGIGNRNMERRVVYVVDAKLSSKHSILLAVRWVGPAYGAKQTVTHVRLQ